MTLDEERLKTVSEALPTRNWGIIKYDPYHRRRGAGSARASRNGIREPKMAEYEPEAESGHAGSEGHVLRYGTMPGGSGKKRARRNVFIPPS